MENFEGKIIEITKLNYYIKTSGSIIKAVLKGSLFKDIKKIYVGDNVIFKKDSSLFVITKVLPRKNENIRPPVSNIDQMLVVISIKNPIPDMLSLDKQIILCMQKNIIPIICINKIDLIDKDSKKVFENIRKTYEDIGIKVIGISTKTRENIEKLSEILYGKTTALSGNSGVGKSSITKILLKEKDEIDVGELTNNFKGKHTTKHVKIYSIDDIGSDTYILDTPGFSSFEINNISYKQLKEYYPEFNSINCTYLDCNHVNEEEKLCKVKQKLTNNLIDRTRYDRYVYLFNKLKEIDDRKYK